jgi:hypothetical protein
MKPNVNLEFVLMPGTSDTLAHSLIRLERLSQKLHGQLIGEGGTKKTEQAWKERDWQFFQGGRGVNRLISLLINAPSAANDDVFKYELRTRVNDFPTRTAVYGLMSWCKSNWYHQDIDYYRKILDEAVILLEIKIGKRVELNFGVGPLLLYICSPHGAKALGQEAFEYPDKWEGLMNFYSLGKQDVTGSFFMEAAKFYLRAELRSPTGSTQWNRNVVNFLRYIEYSSIHGALLYLTSIAIEAFEAAGEDSTELQNFALTAIGDTNSPRWREVHGLPLEEVVSIGKAVEILESWINALFLERFWDIIHDRRRRSFWKNYHRYMRDVRIVLSDEYFGMLNEDLKSTGYLERMHGSTSNALLVFRIKNRTFIEFGQQASGPLQVVIQDDVPDRQLRNRLNASVRSKRGRTPINPQDLKFYSSTDQILTDGYSYFQDFGKLNHQGNWEEKLNSWMRNRGL